MISKIFILDELRFTYDLVRVEDPKWGTIEVGILRDMAINITYGVKLLIKSLLIKLRFL